MNKIRFAVLSLSVLALGACADQSPVEPAPAITAQFATYVGGSCQPGQQLPAGWVCQYDETQSKYAMAQN